MIRLFVGYDPREAVAYHVFTSSVLTKASKPVSITPLSLNTLRDYYRETHTDGSNDFIYTRFLVPAICNYAGWAIFADGDMLCRDDIVKLWRQRDSSKAVQVVQHDYKTKHPVKYLGAPNVDYERKNWSSLILWNCGHPANSRLTPEMLMRQSGAYLHRFKWLKEEEIGGIHETWNWLVTEYEHDPYASLVHHTLGSPCFPEYRDCDYADEWYAELETVLNVQGEEGHAWIDGKKAPRKAKGR